jgi:hypothetical protein
MDKIDFRKDRKHLYQPSAKAVVQIEVPGMNFLMLDGEGDPNTSGAFQEAVEALFALSYTIKFMAKKGVQPIDCAVMPLEGLWQADDVTAFASGDKTGWQWTLMIMQPDFVTASMAAAAKDEVRKKKTLPAADTVRFEQFNEGTCAQIMHIGPFSEEGPAIERLHRFIADSGFRPAGRHHEIYLSDIRKTDPAKWKTVLRQPMRLLIENDLSNDDS